MPGYVLPGTIHYPGDSFGYAPCYPLSITPFAGRFLPKLGNKSGEVFWAGGNTAKSAAVAFARTNGMKTLDMTIKGRILQAIEKYIPEKLANTLWSKASASFAKGAEGTAHVFHNATDGVR
ncbi:MAG: hypothetical protein ACTHMM_03540 [Agriterribacter sp.]